MGSLLLMRLVWELVKFSIQHSEFRIRKWCAFYFEVLKSAVLLLLLRPANTTTKPGHCSNLLALYLQLKPSPPNIGAPQFALPQWQCSSILPSAGLRLLAFLG